MESSPEIQELLQDLSPTEDGPEKKATGNRGLRLRVPGTLRFKIGLFYIILAVVNIMYFSVMIFENQTDLLLSNFKFHSNELVRNVLTETSSITVTNREGESYDRLLTLLDGSGVGDFVIFRSDGTVVHSRGVELDGDQVDGATKRKSMELSGSSTLFRSRYHMELDSDNFAVRFILPLKGEGGEKLFLATSISVSAIKDRMGDLYMQMGLAVAWGILFHTIFAYFVYRIIFRRVEMLTKTSRTMSDGNLDARVSWDMKSGDELDTLGSSFNTMATNIQEKVTTITKLNDQIQNELEIGKDVQELFLPRKNIFTDEEIAIYYRPLREVSGDIYKYYRYKSGQKAIFFADATGHGVSAAIITTITIMSLDNVVRKRSRPNEILGKLNDILSFRLENAFFATGVWIQFHGEGKLSFANAGHLTPWIYRKKTGEIQELERTGPPLGMMEGYDYGLGQAEVDPGDRILIFSDGLTESRSPDHQMFGEENAKELFKSLQHLSCQEMIKGMSETLEARTGAFDDDVSIIALEIP